jgi:hypothetical protein
MDQKKNYAIDLSHAELVFAIEALHDSLLVSLSSAYVDTWDTWRENVDFDMFAMVTNGSLMLYGRLLQLYQENEEQMDEWVKQVQFSDGQWNLLDKLDSATNWSSVNKYTREEFDGF